MGLFSKLKQQQKKSSSPAGTVYHHGQYIPLYPDDGSIPEEKNLPDDFNVLKAMASYYYNYPRGNREPFAIYNVINRKQYKMVQAGLGEDPDGWIKKNYFSKAAPQEEIDAYQFDLFCRSIENSFFTQESLRDGRTSIYIGGVFYSRELGNSSMPYFEEHLPEIIDAVWTLFEKEKRPTSLLHVAYYMYQDLMDYFQSTDLDRKFSFYDPKLDRSYLWKKTYAYLQPAYGYYNDLIKNPNQAIRESRILSQKGELMKLDAEAVYNIPFCSKEALLAAYAEKTQGKSSAAVHPVPETSADIRDADSLYQMGLQSESSNPAKAEDYFYRAMEAGSIDAYLHVADREYAKGQNTDFAAECYKKVLGSLTPEKNPMLAKRLTARIIGHYCKGDVDENTLALASLACDYARLDAPIVKEADLSALLAEAEKGGYKAIDQLEEYYSWYSRGRQAMGTIKGSDIYETDPDRAHEMRQVAKAFRLMKISMLLQLASEDPASYLDDLAQAYLDQGNRAQAEYYAEIGIRHDIPAVLHFAYHNSRKLGYGNEDALEFLQRAASMGYRPSINALEHLAELEEDQRQRMEWVEKHKPSPPSRAELAFELEMLERQLDLMCGGTGSSMEELALSGKVSFADASLLRHYKNRFLDKAEK